MEFVGKQRALALLFLVASQATFLIGAESVEAATRMRVEFNAGPMYLVYSNNSYETTNLGVSGVVEFSFTPDQINELLPNGASVNQGLQRIMITPTFAEVAMYGGGVQFYSKPIGVMLFRNESRLDVAIGSIDPFNGVGSVKSGSDQWSLYRGYGNQFVPSIRYVQARPGLLGVNAEASCWACDGREFLTASFRVLTDEVPPPEPSPSPPPPPPPFVGPVPPPIVLPPGYGVPGIPEPAAWVSMLAGFGLVGGALRRRAKPIRA
jgi:hypothetical protein